MSDVRYTEVSAEEAGQRLDNYLLRILKGVPKSCIYRIVRGGEVRINKKRAKASTRLVIGDSIRIPPVRTSTDKKIHVSVDLAEYLLENIIHEDEQLLVVNKPAGIAVHGGSGLSLGVIEALRKIRQDLPYLELVHRLDKDTSGCLLLAKKRSTLRAIQSLLEARAVHKTYWALLLHSWQDKPVIVVDKALEKNILKSGERLVVVNQEGKASQTHFKLLENFQYACLVEANPKTGRTHQIRVHSAYLGHPVVGDKKYGGNVSSVDLNLEKRPLYLHAHAIQFSLGDKKWNFQANLDTRFAETLQSLRAQVQRSRLGHE